MLAVLRAQPLAGPALAIRTRTRPAEGAPAAAVCQAVLTDRRCVLVLLCAAWGLVDRLTDGGGAKAGE